VRSVAVQFRDGRSYLKHFYETAGSIHPIPSSFSRGHPGRAKILTKGGPLAVLGQLFPSRPSRLCERFPFSALSSLA